MHPGFVASGLLAGYATDANASHGATGDAAARNSVPEAVHARLCLLAQNIVKHGEQRRPQTLMGWAKLLESLRILDVGVRGGGRLFEDVLAEIDQAMMRGEGEQVLGVDEAVVLLSALTGASAAGDQIIGATGRRLFQAGVTAV